MSNNLSRRGFLGSLAAVGAAGVVSVPALAQTVKAPAKWDKTVDFLIVGTGFAGLGAAIEAHEQGIKNILVIDKMPSTAATPSSTAAPLLLPVPTCRKLPASRTILICSLRTS